jgi:hypothetical protein
MAMFPTDPSSVTAAWLSEVLGADVQECRLEQIGIGVGRCTAMCEFELGDEAAAFAYAEERIRATEDND